MPLRRAGSAAETFPGSGTAPPALRSSRRARSQTCRDCTIQTYTCTRHPAIIPIGCHPQGTEQRNAPSAGARHNRRCVRYHDRLAGETFSRAVERSPHRSGPAHSGRTNRGATPRWSCRDRGSELVDLVVGLQVRMLTRRASPDRFASIQHPSWRFRRGGHRTNHCNVARIAP
jgi:hypothetical protein